MELKADHFACDGEDDFEEDGEQDNGVEDALEQELALTVAELVLEQGHKHGFIHCLGFEIVQDALDRPI